MLRPSTALSAQPQAPGDVHLARDIAGIFSDKLSITIESAHTDLFQTGVLDSMTLVQLILQLEERFEVELPMEELDSESFRSVARIAELIATRRQPVFET